MSKKVVRKITFFYSLTALSFGSLTLFTHSIPPSLSTLWLTWINFIYVYGAIGSLRFDTATGLSKYKKISFYTALGASIITLLSTTIFLIFLICLKASGLINLQFTLLLLISSLGFAYSFISIMANLQLSQGNINRYNLFLVMPQLITPLVQIIFIKSFRYTDSLLFIAAATSYWAIVISAIISNRHIINKYFYTRLNPRKIMILLFNRKKFAYYLTPFTVSVLVRERFIYAILSSLPFTSSVALMTMAQKVVNLSNTAVSSPIRPIFLRQSIDKGIANTKKLIPKIVFNLTLLVIPPWLLAINYSKPIFSFIFGPQWSGASIYFYALSPAFFVIATTGWLDRVYEIENRQKQLFIIELVFSIIMAASLIIGREYTSNPEDLVNIMGLVTALYGWGWLFKTYKILNIANKNLYKLFSIQLLLWFWYSFIGNFVSSAHVSLSILSFSTIIISFLGLKGITRPNSLQLN